MRSNSNRNKLSLGITLLIFSFLFLLVKFGFFNDIPSEYNFLILSCFSLVVGISFVLIQPKRVVSWLLFFVAIFDNSGLFIGWINRDSQFVVPSILLFTGLWMILTAHK